MEIYLDNAATTVTNSQVADLVYKVMTKDFGNPSSKHNKGLDAEKYIKNARQIISSSLKVRPEEIFFTSGGTESNNMALRGAALANQRAGKHIISTVYEHASVYNPLLELKNEGFEVDFCPVDELGRIKTDELISMIREDTILVSFMAVNNEIGSVNDIAAICEAVKNKKKDVLIHVDAIQAYGKYRLYPAKWGVDLMTVSGHKIHAPKGSGFIYIKKATKLRPMILGGGQQEDYRSGTENVPAIAGLGLACELIYNDFEEKRERLYKLKSKLADELLKIDGTVINGYNADEDVHLTAPHILSVSFPQMRSEVMLHALEEYGVYVSSGSACSSNHPKISGTLKAIGVKKDLLDNTIRFSFSYETVEDDINTAVKAVNEALNKYGRRVRR